MISVTWSMERKPFCAFGGSIIRSVCLLVCLVEFCSYTQTESYLITWDFREVALKQAGSRSVETDFSGEVQDFICKTVGKETVMGNFALAGVSCAGTRPRISLLWHWLLWIYCRITCGEDVLGWALGVSWHGTCLQPWFCLSWATDLQWKCQWYLEVSWLCAQSKIQLCFWGTWAIFRWPILKKKNPFRLLRFGVTSRCVPLGYVGQCRARALLRKLQDRLFCVPLPPGCLTISKKNREEYKTGNVQTWIAF